MSGTSESRKISTLTIITTLVMLGLFVGLVWIVFLQRQAIPSSSEPKREERAKNLAELNAENQKVLSTYHWVDKSKGVVGLPINRAMEVVLKDLAENHPHPAGPINPPAANPSPSPAANQPSASPAPSASASPAPSPAGSPAPASAPSPGSESSPSPSPSPSPSALQTGNERERAGTSGNALNTRATYHWFDALDACPAPPSHFSPLTSHLSRYVCS